MNVLEKILEEIDMLIETHKNKAFKFVEKEPLTKCYTETDIEQIKVHELAVMKKIIRSHMDEVKDTNVPSKWIPVTDHLPQEKGWYQCSCCDPEAFSDGLVRDLYFYPGIKEFVDNIRYFCNGLKDIEKYYWTKYVVAWKPLPEPYKVKRDCSEKRY